MINLIFDLNEIVIPSITLFLVFCLVIIYWKKILNKINIKSYTKKQRIHENEVPRIGGLIIFLIYISYFAIFNYNLNNFFTSIFISFFPLLIISAKEDLYQNTKPLNRIMIMVLATSIFFAVDKTVFPKLEFILVVNLFNNFYFMLAFFIFSVLVIVNGTNFIDGSNGLMSTTILSQLFCIIFLSLEVGDEFTFSICIILVLPIIIFLIFNFPLGKLFMGDLGAYFFGFTVSMIIIKFFGKHPDLLSWNAILILFYPSIEILFSFLRKIFYEKTAPMQEDNLHLHTIIFDYGKFKNINTKIMNNLILIFLCPFWISPIFIVRYYKDLNIIIISIIMLILIYVILYIYLRIKINELKKKSY